MLKRLFFKFGSTAKEKIIQEKIGKVGVIYLNSKADLNALSQSMRHEIVESVNEFEKDPSVRVITLLSKVEKAFCAGANIKEFENKTTKDFTANDIFESLHFTIDSAKKPIVCGVNGVALGGGMELALLTDVLVCSEEARFGLPELKLGLIPGIGGTQRLPRIAGKVNAMRYILTSEFIVAKRAYQMGLVTEVFKKEQLHQKTLGLATQIAQKSLQNLIVAKNAIKHAEEAPLSQGIRYERAVFYPLFDTYGAKEGIKAFVEKRSPNFDKDDQ